MISSDFSLYVGRQLQLGFDPLAWELHMQLARGALKKQKKKKKRKEKAKRELTSLIFVIALWGWYPLFLHPEFLQGALWAAVAAGLKVGDICCLLKWQTTFFWSPL